MATTLASSKTPKAIVQLRPSLLTPMTVKSWSASRPSVRRLPTRKNTLFAIKRLIGRRSKMRSVQRDLKIMPFGITRADNGDAWLKSGQEDGCPAEFQPKKMKKTAEDFPASR